MIGTYAYYLHKVWVYAQSAEGPLNSTNNCSSTSFCGLICRPFFAGCLLPADPGPCKARKLRYYYNNDPQVKDCVGFAYGGCRGNVNNFETAEECIDKCRSKLELQATQAPRVDGSVDSTEGKKIPGCNSDFGCCDDYVTAARGANQAGCPGWLQS